MATYTWAIAASSDWNTPAAWQLGASFPGIVPGTADTALITLPGTYTISGYVTVDNLGFVAPAATLDLTYSSRMNGLVNGGDLVVAAGTAAISQTLQNVGTITVATGAELDIGSITTLYNVYTAYPIGTLANTGVISLADASTLTLYAATDSATLNAIQHGNALINIFGVVSNAGATLSTAKLGNAQLYGTIDGGTLINDGGTFALLSPGYFFLNRTPILRDVTLWGTLDSGTWAASGDFTVRTLDGHGPGTLDVSSATGSGTLNFLGDTTLDLAVLNLDDNGFLFSQDANNIPATLTLPSGLDLRTPTANDNGRGILAAGFLLAQGTIDNTAGLAMRAFATIDNTGTINATAYLDIATGLVGSPSGAFNNEGLLSLGPTASATLDSPTIINAGTFTANAATLTLHGTLSGLGALTLSNASTLVAPGASLAQTATLEGTGNLLMVTAPSGTFALSGFTQGDTIQIAAPLTIAYAAGTLTANAGTLQIVNFLLPDTPANAQFHASLDSNFNTIITETIPCFATGTRIATLRGPIPVEHLKIGDHVLSAFGGSVPIQWIGHRTVDISRHPTPKSVHPIRIQAHALAHNTPSRDLYVSPEHAIHLDGHLIPAHLLVNGTTITQVPRTSITYFHLELPQHDVILAENTECESYLDTDNRADFANADQVMTLHPTFSADDLWRAPDAQRSAAATKAKASAFPRESAPLHPAMTADELWRSQACAPQCRQGPLLDAIRTRLNRRASHPRSAVA